MGVRAETINSDNQDNWERVEGLVKENQVDILLISTRAFGEFSIYSECACDWQQRQYAGDRRGTLHFRLGSRFQATLSLGTTT